MKRYRITKLICIVLVMILAVPTSVLATQEMDGTVIGNEEAITTNRLFGDDYNFDFVSKLPTGFDKVPTFSDEEIAACEVEDFSEIDGVTPERIHEADEALNEDLMMYEAQTQECESEGISENSLPSVSENDADVKAELLGYTTMEDAADYVRKQMVKRATVISVKLAVGPEFPKGNSSSAKRARKENIKKLLRLSTDYWHECSPKEGDYILWNFRQYEWKEVSLNTQTVTYRVAVKWRSGKAQEDWMDQKIPQIIQQLDLQNPNKTDLQKVTQIYDYIMNTVSYDYAHYNTQAGYYMPMYTAYTALKEGSGVCQAYALIFYRLCKEIGIEARLISGNNDENDTPTHGWNIVKLGDYFYNVDATWDDETADGRTYFLKNMLGFYGHTRDHEYQSNDFMKEFPMALESYEEPVTPCHIPNLDVSFVSRDGDTIKTKTAAPWKYKIFFFLNSLETGTRGMSIDFVKSAFYNKTDCDVVLCDMNTSEYYMKLNFEKRMTETQYETACLKLLGNPANVVYVKQSSEVRTLRNQFAKLQNKRQGNGCLAVLIGPDNYIAYIADGIYQIQKLDAVYQMAKKQKQMADMGAISVKQTKNNKVTINWSAYPGANTYYVYRKSQNGSYYCIGNTNQTSYTNAIPKEGTYTYCVYAASGVDYLASSKEGVVSAKTQYLKKGAIVTAGTNRYKVISSTASSRKVAFMGAKSKSVTKMLVPNDVMIDGMRYKVTEIGANACKNYTKLKIVSLGTNVQKIGANAFGGCKKLCHIGVKSKALKAVGKNAFKGTDKKAIVYVPASKLKAYKKLFSNKGLKQKNAIRK